MYQATKVYIQYLSNYFLIIIALYFYVIIVAPPSLRFYKREFYNSSLVMKLFFNDSRIFDYVIMVYFYCTDPVFADIMIKIILNHHL